MSSIFNGTIRRSGNSLVVTIPKGVADGLKLENGTIIRVEVQKVGDKEESL